ncbi:MAG TPA: GTPase ObgE [Solirubrobacterales bacterium]|jgi:GTPase|nr:GTPase ObgE [Solirubrobacterales bacterium]
MLSDRAKIYVEGGRGGDGMVSFRREAHVPRGGPDGGDGGRGGDVVLVCDPSRRDLASLRFSPHQRAGRGGHGRGKRQHGARGEDAVVLVPPGTQVDGLEGTRYDLTEPGQRAVVARGGPGGHGNKRFASSTRQAPRFAERGLEGESGWIELRLKLLADVGLAGLPNAGKSSLLRRLTRANPKVADYPFTTVEPVLGTIDDGERQLVIADIPGLIEGAAAGAGLGHEFLAHIERCRVLVHLIALGSDADPSAAVEDPESAYETVRAELDAHGAGLSELPEIAVLSKRDLVPDERAEALVAEWRGRLGDRVLDVLAVSSATGAGLDELSKAIFAALPPVAEGRIAADERAAAAEPEFEAEHAVYRPAGEQGFDVEPEDGAFRVRGRGIEQLVARHDLTNVEALAYLEQRLREIGVIAALERAGFEPGDEVRIGDEEFELDPG